MGGQVVAGAPELVRLLRLEDAIPSLRMSHVRAMDPQLASGSDLEEGFDPLHCYLALLCGGLTLS